jgi:hypothetical protein
MVRFTKLSAIAALALAVSVAVPAHAAEKSPIKVEKPASFKAVNQVVIGQFTVAYFTKKVDYDGGGFLAAGNKGKAIGHLSGLTPADYQKTTDAVYDDFVKQLAAHGITVVDASGLTSNKYYAKVKQEAQGAKMDVVLKKQDHADAVAYWPTALGRNNNMLVPMRLMDFSMSHTYTAQYDYARTSQIPVLNVIYFIDFAKPATSSGAGLFQSITAKAGLAVSQFGTQIGLMDTTGKLAKISLAVPVEEGGDFANIDETTTGASKAVRVASILGAGMFGGNAGTMASKFDYQVTDPAAYGEKALSASAKVSDLFIRQIEALR